MSDILLKLNYLNLKVNQFFHFPNIIPFDPDTQSFKCHGKGTKDLNRFLIHSIVPITAELVTITVIAELTILHSVRLSNEQKISLRNPAMVIPISGTMSAVLHSYGQDFTAVANWALETQRKYNFQLSKKWKDGLLILTLKGKYLKHFRLYVTF